MKQKIVYFILAVLVLMGGNAMADIKYSRHHQAFLRLILNRQPGQAVLELKNYLKNHPGDAEAYYSLVLAHAQMGHPDRSIESIKRGLELGLDPVRFLAGPRFLLNPIEETAFMQKLGKDYLNKPIHGPMIGSVTESSARFWVRTLQEAIVQIRVSRSANIESAVSSPKVKTLHSSDYTARLRVEGLESNTRYYYWVVINDSVSTPFQQFKTFPKSGTPAMFRVVFGGGAGYYPDHERMWETIRSSDPLALLMLGDNVYIDDPFRPAMQRYCYYRRQSRPEWRRLTASTAVYSIWDDHDFSDNDSWGGPHIPNAFDWENRVSDRWQQNGLHIFLPDRITDTTAGGWNGEGWSPYIESDHQDNRFDLDLEFSPERQKGRYVLDASFKPIVWDIFQQNWINPKNHNSPDLPGTFYSFSIGQVDFFMLDCRYYRENPHVSGRIPSMLGDRQKKWLKENLKNSTAVFKVVVSSVPWEFNAKGNSLDTWNGFRSERNEIFEYIQTNQIDGVFLLSADRHRSDVYKIPWPEGYDFYEFESSRLTNPESHPTMDHALFSYNAKQSYGMLEFDTRKKNSTVTFKIVNIDGEIVYTLKLDKNQLKGPNMKSNE